MADQMLGVPDLNFVNSLKAVANPGIGSSLTNASNYVSITAMRSRLTALNAGYYTAAKLNEMSVNDMVFALRSIDDKTTICDYMPTSTA